MTTRIAQRLGIRLPVGRAGDARLRLAGDTLRFVDDADVRGEGRLVLVPGRGRGRLDGGAGRDRDSDGDLCVLALGWATVDTERAASEFVSALDLPGTATSVDRDRLVGAYAHQLVDERFPGGRLVILEPSTEGRLAATLARDGEGPAVLYLGAFGGLDAWIAQVRRLGVVVSRAEDGPLGRSVLILGGSPSGPHLIVADA
jgi:hypothetical protein